MNIDEVMAKLGKKTRDRLVMAQDVEVRRQPTISSGLNLALQGGIGFGRQTLVWGPKSAGKTAWALGTIGKAQEDGVIAGFIDAEGTFDPTWAKRLGVDTGNLIVGSNVKTISDMADVAVELVDSGVEILVVDSISALLSSAYFEKDKEELKELDKTKQIGSEAKDLANAVKMLNYVNSKCALILISQVRNKITTYGASQQPTGGFAVDFFSSTVIKLSASPRDDDQIKGSVQVGDRVFEQPIGRKVEWTVTKNKMGPPNQVGEYNFYYDGDFVGVDNAGESLGLGVKFGLVEKSGNWFILGDEKFNGAPKAAKYLRENRAVLDKLNSDLLAVTG